MLFSEEFIHAFGWTILHSLWQATLIAAILVLFLRKLKSASALSRYWAAVAALSTVLVVAIFTFTQIYERNGDHFLIEESSTQIFLYGDHHYSFIVESAPSETVFFASPVEHWSTFLENQLPIISLLWIIGVLFFSMRFGFGLLEIERLRKTRNFSLGLDWEKRMKNLAIQLGISEKVQLRESLLTNVPIALGHFKPLILLPIGTINALPIEQVEAILAHELAHIARKDYLVNLLQSMVEIFFFFNPAVWWMSAQIRMERENCCDDQAMSVCDDKLTYAKALLQLKEIQYRTPALSLSLFSSKNQLLQRVQRILNHPNQESRIMEKFAVTCLLLITFIFFGLQQNKAAELEMPITELELPTIEEELPIVELVMPIMEAEEAPFFIAVDTLPNPKKGRTRITFNEDGKMIETEVINGVIQFLTIDGEEIPESEFGEYESMVQQLIDDLPEPPIPPVAPSSPPSPPSSFVAPPAPPSPPSPPSIYEAEEVHRSLEVEQRILEEEYRNMEKEHEVIQRQHLEIEKEHKAIEELHRQIEKEHEKIEEAHREIEREHRAMEKRNTDFMRNLGKNLIKDGLIQDTKDYEFELDNKQLKVNGKVQSASAFEKYKKLIEEHKAKELSSKDRVKIEVSKNNQSIHFDFSMGGGKYRNEGPMPEQMLENLYATEALFDKTEVGDTRSLHRKKLMQKIGQSLKQDQVLSNAKRYSFILNARTQKLVVNGQHYPDLQAKYETIIRKAADFEMSSDFIYEFEYRGQLAPHIELSNCFPNEDRTYGPMADAYQTYIFDNFAFSRQLSNNLKQDDLISQSTFKLRINNEELVINGQRQSDDFQARYESLFRTAANVELTESFQLTVEKYNNGYASFIVGAI